MLADSQTFFVLGYPVTITTLNLAGQIAPSILVVVQDPAAYTSYNATSGVNGVAGFNLETGSYNVTASYKGSPIGQINIAVTGAGNFNFICKLTDLVVKVQNENGTTLPSVNLVISSSLTGSVSGQTGPSGTFTVNSTLSGINYIINATLYNQQFNPKNDTLSNLPAQASYQFVVICPTEAQTINVVGYNNEAISGASLRLVEVTNGLFFTATTDSSGSATAPLTFGTYKLQIYQNNFLLNETTLKAFSPAQTTIRCTLYGIQVEVSVVDYFGSPISNANVTVNGPASEHFSVMTPGNGKATFNDVVGGNLQIIAFAKGAQSSYQTLSLTANQPTSVQIKMGGYVALGGLLIPTTALITLIFIVVAIVLLIVVEMFLRQRRRANQT